MKRDKMIKRLWRMLEEGKVHEADRACCDWNSKHGDAEIFMEFEDSYIALEDDVYYL